jgi:hypothetical protein
MALPRGHLPADPNAGHPRGAAQIREHWRRLAELAFREALRRDPTLRERYDARWLRTFLRDYERHLEQLAQALAAGSDEPIRQYGVWLAPLLRRRRVPTADFLTFVMAMEPAVRTVLIPAEDDAVQGLLERWAKRQQRYRKIAGDRKRNPILSFFWKGVGIAD